MDNISYTKCRVCGFEEYEDNAPFKLIDGIVYPSYEVCPCCNCQHGYDVDTDGGGVSIHREKWIKEGGKFHSRNLKPVNWTLENQLLEIEDEWK